MLSWQLIFVFSINPLIHEAILIFSMLIFFDVILPIYHLVFVKYQQVMFNCFNGIDLRIRVDSILPNIDNYFETLCIAIYYEMKLFLSLNLKARHVNMCSYSFPQDDWLSCRYEI